MSEDIRFEFMWLQKENDRLKQEIEERGKRISRLESDLEEAQLEAKEAEDEAEQIEKLARIDEPIMVEIVKERHDLLCAGNLPADTTGTGEFRYKQPLHCCPDPLCRLAVEMLHIRGDGNR